MTVLVYVEHTPDGLDDVSAQALAFARSLADAEPLAAIIACNSLLQALPAQLGAHGVETLHVAEDPVFEATAPVATARATVAAIEASGAAIVVGPGTEGGNEVMAHVAAVLDEPLAANCIAAGAGEPTVVTRVRWGGSLLEEARLHPARTALLTVQPHSVPAVETGGAPAAVVALAVALDEADRAVRVVDRVGAAAGGVSLADAKVVVTGGRGVGSEDGFAPVEELAALLGGAVGCSRAVTMAGWRPHTDQVGQTGNKIAPEIYIACGVSGATQHIAGCKGAKRILAVNTDPEAPIMSVADYAVVGDLHEVLPAISEQLRRARA